MRVGHDIDVYTTVAIIASIRGFFRAPLTWYELVRAVFLSVDQFYFVMSASILLQVKRDAHPVLALFYHAVMDCLVVCELPFWQGLCRATAVGYYKRGLPRHDYSSFTSI